MCTYCNMGDFTFRYDPPWTPHPPIPSIPAPMVPVTPWPLEKLQEYYDLLKEVNEMEDKLGCPCEPNKADYLKLFKDRIDKLKRKPKRKPKRKATP